MGTRLSILDDFAAEGSLFSSRALRERLGISPQAASNLLARWQRDGLVERVARGRYAIRPLGALGTRAASEDVALAVAAVFEGQPHRLAFRSALDYHGLLLHPVRSIQVAAPERRHLASISGRRLRVVREAEKTIDIGAVTVTAGARVSSPARALLDAAARPDLGGGPMILAEALHASDVNANELALLARELNAGAALRRIGTIADRLDIPELADGLAPLAPPRSDIALDTRDKHREWRDPRWHVSWPIRPEDLGQDVRQ